MRAVELAGGVGELVVGDCVEAMRDLLYDREIDAIVTDPPYGLGFMGKAWDTLGGDVTATPGSKVLGGRPVDWISHGGSGFGSANPSCARCGGRLRGAKRCTCASPDWRVKGQRVVRQNEGHAQQRWHEQWSAEALRVLKPGGHLVAFGGQRTIHRLTCAVEDAGFDIRDQIQWLQWQGFPKSLDVHKAAAKELAKGTLDDARRYLGGELVDEALEAYACEFAGVGTALKPTAEPAILARRPLEGTVAANVLEYGVGGLNIDACRYALGDKSWPGPQGKAPGTQCSKRDPDGRCLGHKNAGRSTERETFHGPTIAEPVGRWPANVYHCPKTSTKERERGLEHLARATAGELTGGRAEGSAGLSSPRAGAGRTSKAGRANTHPTVKSIELMRWLVRLVCPPGGVVLDPFLGSGTTAIACGLEGRRCVGFELSDEYAEIAAARVAGWASEFVGG